MARTYIYVVRIRLKYFVLHISDSLGLHTNVYISGGIRGGNKSKDLSLIVTVLKNNLGERSCDIFEFEAGLIVREYEFIIFGDNLNE